MRYVVLAALGVLGTLLNGSVLSNLPTGGMQVDVLLLIAVSLALLEKTSMPVIFAAGFGLLLGLLYSVRPGVYALGLTAAVSLALFTGKRGKKMNPLFVFVYGAAGYVIKELVTAAALGALGVPVSFMRMMAGSVLPSALLAGALTYVPWLLIGRLYTKNWMRPRTNFGVDDLNF